MSPHTNSTPRERTAAQTGAGCDSHTGARPQRQAGDAVTAAILDWLARIGAAAPAELAAVCGRSERVTGARLRSLEEARLLSTARLLHGAPPLCVLTRAGLRAAGRVELEPVAISASGFAHLQAVARIALALEQAGIRVGGERELRAWERLEGRPLASAEVGMARDGGVALHRPDLVCWDGPAPLAIEVELSVKSPERLATIVRGWARSRLIGGVVYYAAPAAMRALARAVRAQSAERCVTLVALEEALDGGAAAVAFAAMARAGAAERPGAFRPASSIPSAA
jgi:hypothetical protein